MDAFLQQFQHLRIQLEEITSATNNFNDEKNCIGIGGFGKVYKGEVTHSEGRSVAAIKRLDRRHGQGIPEFLKEITTLSRYSHENLISLLGFCYEGHEMILVYEHASRGSLDNHLNSPHLTWSQRLKICLDAAKGLSYLHDPRETHQRLIHCDMKISSNILLDDHWNAKISDLGLSIMGPANEQQSVIVTVAAGTPGYCDPRYAMTHTLTKESDVYSFGVVLFEVLCGRLCCAYSNGRLQQNLVPTWLESYKQKKLIDIIFKNPTNEPLDKSSFEIVSDIAYRCLKESREDRPKMGELVTELGAALESQEFVEWKAQIFYFEELTKSAEPPLNYRSNGELWKLLSKGVLLNGGKTWFSLNKKGEHCEFISLAECLVSEFKSNPWSPILWLKFARRPYYTENGIFETRVKTQFLSPGITYTVNLVFIMHLINGRKFRDLICLKYRLQGETKTSISFLADKREDGWWMCELYQFTSDHRTIDLEILFDGYDKYSSAPIEVEGIEFRPLEKVEHKNGKESLSDSVANREEKLPTDYEDKDMMKLSKNSMQWTTKKESYSVITKGFLINDGKEWVSLDKEGKKCHMLSARAACQGGCYGEHHWVHVPKSRFGEAVEFTSWDWKVKIISKVETQRLSSQTAYACYLVYKLPNDQSGFETPMLVENGEFNAYAYWYIYLVSPQTRVIRPKVDENTHNPLNRPKIIGVPKQRDDGWMEVQIWEFRTAITTEMIPMHLQLTPSLSETFCGLIIEGVEFRPI